MRFLTAILICSLTVMGSGSLATGHMEKLQDKQKFSGTGRRLMQLQCGVAVQYQVLNLNATGYTAKLQAFNNQEVPLPSWHVTWRTANGSNLVITQTDPFLASSASNSLSTGPDSSAISPGSSGSVVVISNYYATSEDVLIGIEGVAVNSYTCTQLDATVSKPTDDKATLLGYSQCSLRGLRQVTSANATASPLCTQNFCCQSAPGIDAPTAVQSSDTLSPSSANYPVVAPQPSQGLSPQSSPQRAEDLSQESHLAPVPSPSQALVPSPQVLGSDALLSPSINMSSSPQPSESPLLVKSPSVQPTSSLQSLSLAPEAKDPPSISTSEQQPKNLSRIFTEPPTLGLNPSFISSVPSTLGAVNGGSPSPGVGAITQPANSHQSASHSSHKTIALAVGVVVGSALAITSLLLWCWTARKRRERGVMNLEKNIDLEHGRPAIVEPFDGGLKELEHLWESEERKGAVPNISKALLLPAQKGKVIKHLKLGEGSNFVHNGNLEPTETIKAYPSSQESLLPPQLRRLNTAQLSARRWSWSGEDIESLSGQPSSITRTFSAQSLDSTLHERFLSNSSTLSSAPESPFSLHGTSMSLQRILLNPAISVNTSQGGTSPKACLDIDFAKDIILHEKIGAGAFGTVFKGTWQQQDVAVKIMTSNGNLSASEVESFKQEVKVLSALQHPRIVQLLGACMAPPTLCLVEELATQGSLYDLLHIKSPSRGLLYEQILQIALDVAEGMAYLHPAVVHRDLKSSNVLLNSSGRAEISDFGIAAFKERTFISTKNAQAGTPSYMVTNLTPLTIDNEVKSTALELEAPEMFEAGKLSEKIDQYAFAVLLWEAFTGRLPWHNLTNPMQVIYVVGVLKRRPRIPQDCPHGLTQLIMACWHENPAIRPDFQSICQSLRILQREYRRDKGMP